VDLSPLGRFATAGRRQAYKIHVAHVNYVGYKKAGLLETDWFGKNSFLHQMTWELL
jgi:hypothetical protein